MPAETQAPLSDPVSVSCASCGFSHYGKFHDLELVAINHSRQAHSVRLYLGSTEVGAYVDGAFVAKRKP